MSDLSREDYLELLKGMGKFEEAKEYYDYIFSNNNITLSDGHLCYWEDYFKIVELIPKDKIVIDVGCSFGLQHVLFKDHKMYIGVQKFRDGSNCYGNCNPYFRTFFDNAIILGGEFKELASLLEPLIRGNEDKFFGIANHSLWHDPAKNEDDIKWFKKLFPVNYHVTDNENKLVKYET